MTDHDDITETLAPKSEQLDNIELTPEGTIFTVERVEIKRGTEQPVHVYLADFPRPWKPGVTMRRVLGHCWGKKSSLWAGRRVHLYRDPSISYGRDKTGGTRIRALSHIDGPMDAPVLLSQGRSSTYHVEPLAEPAPTSKPTEPTEEQVAASTSTDELGAMWKISGPEMRARIEARATALKARATADGPMVTRPESEGTDPWAQSGESLLDQGAGS